MNPQNLDQVQRLLLRQTRLESDLAVLRSDLNDLEYRIKFPPSIPPQRLTTLPPIPVEQTHKKPTDTVPAYDSWEQRETRFESPPPQTVPPIPVRESVNAASIPHFPPLSQDARYSPAPPVAHQPAPRPTEPAAPPESFEVLFGRWLARMGVLFALITLISFSTLAYNDLYQYMGPWSKDAVLALVSVAFIWGGLRLERTNEKLLIFGRTLAAGGLGCLYYTLYGATYVAQLQVITNPVIGGLLLLGWSGYVLFLAEEKKSELLSIFSISLAYFSSLITPVGEFGLISNLILSATAVLFLIRNAWASLSYVCLVGTYVGFLRQILYWDPDHFHYSLIADIPFFPCAAYVTGAWFIYTAAVFLARTPEFESAKRVAFLCLNNGGFLGLLLLAASLSGAGHLGAILILVGVGWIATGYALQYVRDDAEEAVQAYVIQGLGAGTGGLVVAYNGATRGLLLALESLFLTAAAAYSKNDFFRAGGCVAGFLATAFLIDEVGQAEHPWVLIAAGTVAMFINAWLARRNLWSESCAPDDRAISLGATFYSLLGMALLWLGIRSQFTDSTSIAILSIAALIITFSVYVVPVFEWPLLSQIILVGVQIAAIQPGGPASSDPVWKQGLVILITLILSGWWSLQRIVWSGAARQTVLILNALAMVPLFHALIHPRVDEESWMISASALSLGFLLFGYCIRSWSYPIVGQSLLAFAVLQFFVGIHGSFTWDVWGIVIPIGVVVATCFLVQEWLKQTDDGSPQSGIRGALKSAIPIYQGLAVLMVIRSIFGVVPDPALVLSFTACGTVCLIWGLIRRNSTLLRWTLVFDGFGIFAYLANSNGSVAFDGLGLALFLTQPFLLKIFADSLLSDAEHWLLVGGSVGMGWLFVSHEITKMDSDSLALGWSLYAMGVIFVGFVADQRKHRWCGLAILALAIGRAGLFDFWTLSDAGKVMTFFVLSVACLGLSYVYYRFADQIKSWL